MVFVKEKIFNHLPTLLKTCAYVKKKTQRKYFFNPHCIDKMFFYINHTKPWSLQEKLNGKGS